MSDTRNFKSEFCVTAAKYFTVFLLVFCVVSISGCLSSTKVYNTQKTVTYRGELYNVSNVQKIGTRVEGRTPDGQVINMKGMDKKKAGKVLDEHPSLVVSTVFDMDEQQMVYQRSEVTSTSQFSKMVSNFEKAGSKLSKFMANKKSTQLKL
ncbi:hypothetical protein ACFL0N_00360 [Pseudomonadota bacterium]